MPLNRVWFSGSYESYTGYEFSLFSVLNSVNFVSLWGLPISPCGEIQVAAYFLSQFHIYKLSIMVSEVYRC